MIRLWLFVILCSAVWNNGTICAAAVPPLVSDSMLAVSQGDDGSVIKTFRGMSGEEVSLPTTAYIRWDEQSLIIRFDCTDSQITSRELPRDGELWFDDCVEVFLDPGHTHDPSSSWVQVMANASGSIFDARGGDPTVNINGLKVLSTKTTEGWRVEMTIPWDGLGIRPQPGDVWGFNVNREKHPDTAYQCWSPTFGAFNNIQQWGHLVFTDANHSIATVRDAVNKRHDEVALRYRARVAELESSLKSANMTMADLTDEVTWMQTLFDGKELAPGQTWTIIDGVEYGAKPDARGPIGGGAGYTGIITGGKYHVATLDALLAALRKAQPGETVFIDGEAEIDCTDRVKVEGLVIEIPGGVTLAGNRGYRSSRGPLLFSDEFKTIPLIRIMGPNARVTGLRLRGPDQKPRQEHHLRAFGNGKTDSDYYYALPNSEAINTKFPAEVDNCEIYGWSHAGIFLNGGMGHLVHHNYIHHNQRIGLGYGICHGSHPCSSLIEYNLFNHNKHSIAGTGVPGVSYEARHNVELGYALEHNFDMHGGRDRLDGTDIAGTRIKIYHNTFRGRRLPVNIRGVPEEGAEIYRNWFYRRPTEPDVLTSGNTLVYDNAYGLSEPVVCDTMPGAKTRKADE